jgi:S1-C subfamily serine protease
MKNQQPYHWQMQTRRRMTASCASAAPQNEWFAVSYGKVTSGIEKFGELQGYPSNAMKHTAYIHSGSSGGAALNEQMQLCGITPGGSYSPDGKDFRYGVLIPVSEIRLCLEDWNR